MPDGLHLLKGAELRKAALLQQPLALPDGTAQIDGTMGIRTKGDDLTAQIMVHFQPLGIGQRQMAPIGVQLNAAAVGNQDWYG